MKEVQLSMAHQGFIGPAVLKKNNRGIFIELSLCDIQANSGSNGKRMKGHLSRLKYEQNGNMIPTEIRNAKVKIPLEACKFSRHQKRHRYRCCVHARLEITICRRARLSLCSGYRYD